MTQHKLAERIERVRDDLDVAINGLSNNDPRFGSAMIQSDDIQDKIAALIMGKVSLAAFERWLAENSLNMFRDSADEAVKLVAAVNLLVSELHDDVIDQLEFRSDMIALAKRTDVMSLSFDDNFKAKIESSRRAISTVWLSVSPDPQHAPVVLPDLA